ncbi:MAG: aldehyde ferredoxin oxidoreductase N-terminal domain-containing protein, partial [Chloroflexota bacterium]|nr:aldehyde ferredoxin oxidoreductase N-terminal domain-containing protein [Chloroflexota bacterium]
MKSFWGRYLEIDLSRQEYRAIPLEDKVFQEYLGGAGLAVWLLVRYAPAGCDPLGEENPLIFASSPLLGTMAPASGKYAVATKSPLTGFIGDSISSGSWALELKRAGYDALVVRGIAPDWQYLFIQEGEVHFRDAAALRGLTSPQVDAAIRKELADMEVRVVSTGLGGENLVRYAGLTNDDGRQAGRTGTGAVMGAKKLKAIAVRGSQEIAVADPVHFEALSQEIFIQAQGPLTEKYRVLGTTSNLLVLNRLGVLPTRNFQQGTFEGASAISGEELGRRFLGEVAACLACPIGCDHRYLVPEEAGKEAAQVGMDYQTLYALGPA